MRESARGRAAKSTAATPKSRSENLFRVIAKHRYPRKTAEHVSALTGRPPSTVYDWMADRTEAPFSVFIALLSGHS
jgi:hypothetical protein